MAQYVAPVRGGAVCECCGVLVAAYRVMPPQGGCRVRFHRCVCGWMGKSVEKLEVEYWHHEGRADDAGEEKKLTTE